VKPGEEGWSLSNLNCSAVRANGEVEWRGEMYDQREEREVVSRTENMAISNKYTNIVAM